MALRIHLTILLTGLTATCGKNVDIQMQSDGSSGQSETNPATMSSNTDNDASTSSPTTSGTSTGIVLDTTSIASSDSDTSTTMMMDLGQAGCDPWTQDCPPGEKCSWYSSGGGALWDTTKCFPLMKDPVPVWADCFASGGGVTGLDNCDRGAMCRDVMGDMGHCVALCGGAPEEPECPKKTFCRVFSGGFALCMESCDPIVQDCTFLGDMCIEGDVSKFTCIEDLSGDAGQIHDACEAYNVCDPGNVCLPPSSAVECNPENPGCCEPYCDTTLPNSCPGQGQVCLPYFQEPVPPEYANVGNCSIPG